MTSDQPPFRSLPRAERRDRIVLAAKQVLLDKGFDAASMDDVAARAGTTKPTVYAHFKSKDELFAGVVEWIKGRFRGALRGPEVYASDPVEAVALFCGRFIELVCWRDAVGYQRVTLAAAGRAPAIAQAVYDTLHAEARRSLATYLRTGGMTATPEPMAELLLAATTGGPILRHLFGVDEPDPHLPDAERIGDRVDMPRIRAAVQLIAAQWSRRSADL